MCEVKTYIELCINMFWKLSFRQPSAIDALLDKEVKVLVCVCVLWLISVYIVYVGSLQCHVV